MQAWVNAGSQWRAADAEQLAEMVRGAKFIVGPPRDGVRTQLVQQAVQSYFNAKSLADDNAAARMSVLHLAEAVFPLLSPQDREAIVGFLDKRYAADRSVLPQASIAEIQELRLALTSLGGEARAAEITRNWIAGSDQWRQSNPFECARLAAALLKDGSQDSGQAAQRLIDLATGSLLAQPRNSGQELQWLGSIDDALVELAPLLSADQKESLRRELFGSLLGDPGTLSSLDVTTLTRLRSTLQKMDYPASDLASLTSSWFDATRPWQQARDPRDLLAVLRVTDPTDPAAASRLQTILTYGSGMIQPGVTDPRLIVDWFEGLSRLAPDAAKVTVAEQFRTQVLANIALLGIQNPSDIRRLQESAERLGIEEEQINDIFVRWFEANKEWRDYGPQQLLQLISLSQRSAVRPDNFSARWSGFLVPQHAGELKVMIAVRGRTRLWLKDVLVIDGWNNEADRLLESQSIDVAANDELPFKLEFSSSDGKPFLRLAWTTPDSVEEIPPSAFRQASGSSEARDAGIDLTVFADKDFGKGVLQRVDPRVDLQWPGRQVRRNQRDPLPPFLANEPIRQTIVNQFCARFAGDPGFLTGASTDLVAACLPAVIAAADGQQRGQFMRALAIDPRALEGLSVERLTITLEAFGPSAGDTPASLLASWISANDRPGFYLTYLGRPQRQCERAHTGSLHEDLKGAWSTADPTGSHVQACRAVVLEGNQHPSPLALEIMAIASANAGSLDRWRQEVSTRLSDPNGTADLKTTWFLAQATLAIEDGNLSACEHATDLAVAAATSPDAWLAAMSLYAVLIENYVWSNNIPSAEALIARLQTQWLDVARTGYADTVRYLQTLPGFARAMQAPGVPWYGNTFEHLMAKELHNAQN